MPTLIIQPCEIDNVLDEQNPDRNFGSETYFYILTNTTIRRRSILKFNFQDLPEGAVIISATLGLYYYSNIMDPVGRICWAYELTQPAWTELGSTWNKYDGVNNWVSPGGDFITGNGAQAIIPAAYGWVNWDVTALMIHFQLDHNKIAHLLLKDGSEGTEYFAYIFYSREIFAPNDVNRPKLTINYEMPSVKIF